MRLLILGVELDGSGVLYETTLAAASDPDRKRSSLTKRLSRALPINASKEARVIVCFARLFRRYRQFPQASLATRPPRSWKKRNGAPLHAPRSGVCSQWHRKKMKPPRDEKSNTLHRRSVIGTEKRRSDTFRAMGGQGI